MLPSLSTSRKNGWSGAALHSGRTYGARGRCCLCRSAGGAAASSISVSPEEAPLGFGASPADESLTLGLGPELHSTPASTSGCGAGGAGFWGGGGGIEEDGEGTALPSTSAADDASWDSASGCGGGGEGLGGGGGGMEAEVGLGGGGGGMEVVEKEGLGFRGGGGGMEGSMAAACGCDGSGGRLAQRSPCRVRERARAGPRTG